MTIPSRGFGEKQASRWFVAAIVSINVFMATYASVRHYVTIDEARMISAGLLHWDSSTFEPANDSPPLARLIAALPILPLNPHRPPADGILKQDRYCEVDAQCARDFANINALNYDKLARIARIPTLFWWAFGAWLIASWACELYGTRASLLALALWAFSPNILARESLATPDLPAAVACLAATYIFTHWLSQPTFTQAIAVGLSLGLALITDFTSLSLFIVWPLLAFTKRLRKGDGVLSVKYEGLLTQLGLILILGVWVVNSAYGFSKSGRPLGALQFSSAASSNKETNGIASATHDVQNTRHARNPFHGSWLEQVPVPIPADYLYGIDRRLQEAKALVESADTDLMRVTSRGIVSPYLLASKIPIAVLVMIYWSLMIAARHGFSSPDWVVWIPAAAIAALAFSPAAFLFPSAGMLLAAPFAIIGVSRLACFFDLKQRKAGFIVASLALAMVLGTLAYYPHLLSYENEATFGLNQLRLTANHPVGDSGQGFRELKAWLDGHPEASPIGLACQYLIDPRSLGVEYNHVPVAPQSPPPHDPWYAERLGPRPGFFALDACNLALPKYRYFAELTPIFKAGGAIHVFHITSDKANQIRRQMGLTDTNSSRELKTWLDRHPEASPIGLACQYLIDPRSMGVEYNHVPVAPQSPPPYDPWYAERVGPHPGFFALDAYNLALPKYRYFAELTPVFKAGDTIHVFHITSDKANQLRRQMGLPSTQELPPSSRPGDKRGLLRFSRRDTRGGMMNYALFVPHNYRPDLSYPLILFLHGFGDRGTDGEQYLKVGFPPALARRSKDFDFFALIPQGRDGAWPPGSGDTLTAIEILDEIKSQYNINDKKLYLTGLSSGGAGVWPSAAYSPNLWAAIVPVATAECDPRLADAIKNIPCWCFHNYFDVSKSPVIPRRMIAAIKQAGGHPRYTEFYETTGDKHNAWDAAYNLDELYDWLAEQTKPD